jgi:uncharacterized protein with von Willebrand factor type A (vWA) domain
VVDQARDTQLDVIGKTGYERFLYRQSKAALPDLAALEADGAEHNGCWPHLVEDLYASLYKAQPEVLEDTQAPEAHQRLIDQTMQSLSYDQLRASTRLNEVGSSIATLELAEQLRKQLPAGEPKRDPDDPSDGGWEYLQGCKGAGEQGRAIRSMVREAKARTSETMEMLQALGCGSGAGGGGLADLQKADEVRKTMHRDSEEMRKIIHVGGRLRLGAATKAKTKLDREPEEAVDVELGNDLPMVFSDELACMGMGGAMATLAYARYAQADLFQARMEASRTLVKGPLVVCVDESGSMSGDRHVWAKGLVLAMLSVAKREKRAFAVVRFGSSHECEVHRFDNSSEPDTADLLAALASFFGGGTSFARPLDEAMRLIEAAREGEAFNRADVLFVTDGACSLDDGFRREYRERKKATSASLYTIYIGTRSRSLDDLSDGVAYMTDPDNDGDALELAFGF